MIVWLVLVATGFARVRCSENDARRELRFIGSVREIGSGAHHTRKGAKQPTRDYDAVHPG